jgi:sulfite reductase (NADPH) flavoprotein alpha-component
MIRLLHRWPALIAAVILSLLGLSGAMLSVFPALETSRTASTVGLSVAGLATRILATNPGVTEIDRSATGQITAFFDSGSAAPQLIDPTTGARLGDVTTSGFYQFLIEVHRSLFLSDTGRIIMAVAAFAMLGLALSGLMLLARRSGGWRKLFLPQQGTGGFHAALGRLAIVGLTISAITALWMTAATFGLLPQSAPPAFPAKVSGQSGVAVADIAVLTQTPVAALDQLIFPAAGDPTDVFTLKTSAGQGYVDQGTGQILAWSPATVWDWLTRLLTALHTGRGAAISGLALGLMALGLPVMSWTGMAQYLARRRRTRRSAPAAQAEIVVLVGSEGGSTWGFAETLRAALTEKGLAVHVAPLSEFAPKAWPRAELALILAATYGAGEAPTSARGFLDVLKALPEAPRMPLAVLGFGDRSFPDFCAYADQISEAAAALGWDQVLPMTTVDRQSAQDFARWGRDLSSVLGLKFELHHLPEKPETQGLTLISRRDYGEAVQAPTAILRFALPESTLWQRLTGRSWHFRAGDLLGIVPHGATLPRFYSLASGRADGFVEICVRKHPGGLCSSQLLSLEPGGEVQAFLRPNRGFHPAAGKAPVILIGAGTGIGPLAGFARANTFKRPMHLFFGLRHPSSDLLYGEELELWLADGHLRSVKAAFSRGAPKTYVQDELRRDAARLVKLVQAGAQILVCGGRDMATGVRATLEDILLPAGMTPALLKAEGRYAEDVY